MFDQSWKELTEEERDMIDINIEDNKDLYVDYTKGIEFLKQIKDEEYSYPEGITNFHVYTEFKNPKELLVLESFLATQNLKKTKLVVWSDYDIRSHLGIQPYKDLDCLEFKLYDPYEEAKGTPVEAASQLAAHDTKYYLKSDLLRILAGYKYGGVWVDMDIVFLRDFKPILDQEYMYQWGGETDFANQGACASVLSLFKGSEFATELLRELLIMPVIQNSTIWGKDMFAQLWRRYPKFTVFPSTFFNTEWLISKISKEDSVEADQSMFTKPVKDDDFLFLDAFAWHWHNSSNKNKEVVKNSKFDILQRRTKQRLRERGILF
jgi:hypothetical protein